MSKRTRRNNRIIIGTIVGMVMLVVLGIIFQKPPVQSVLAGTPTTVYRTATCGCCVNYAKYLKRLGLNVEEKIIDKISDVKKELGVPTSLTSCHTTKIGGYVVEGHIPIEAIEKLMAEKPQVSGIALPDMPSGSPGMPGAKEPFFIKSFTSSTTSDYLTL